MHSTNHALIHTQLQKLSHFEVLQRTKEIALEERRIGIQLLQYLQEVERRRIFAPQFSSLHEYAVRELGYSDGAANRRISAMRLLRAVPELEPKLRDGSVNLSTASRVQHFITAEKRITGKPVSQESTRELVQQISGKSARETDALLAARSPRVAAILQERPRFIDGQNVQINITLTPELQKKLRRLRDRMAHQNPNPSLAEQLEMLADFVLKKLEGKPAQTSGGASPPEGSPETKNGKSDRRISDNSASHLAISAGEKVAASYTPATPTFQTARSDVGAVRSRQAIPRTSTRTSPRTIQPAVRRQIWNRAGSRCEFRSRDGSRCTRTHLLQLDHRIPVAWGGGREPENLQLLCAVHNQWKSDRLPGSQ